MRHADLFDHTYLKVKATGGYRMKNYLFGYKHTLRSDAFYEHKIHYDVFC